MRDALEHRPSEQIADSKNGTRAATARSGQEGIQTPALSTNSRIARPTFSHATKIAKEIVKSLKAPFQTVQEVEQNQLESELGFAEKSQNFNFEKIHLLPQQRDETNNQVYDFTQPEGRFYEKQKTSSKPDKTLIVEKPPLSGEVLKAGNVEKVNLKEVEADIKKAIAF